MLVSPRWGAAPTLGKVGLGADAPTNWHEIFLDSPAAHAWGGARGWDLKGDNPGRVSDHCHSYQYPDNWQLYHVFLADALTEADRREQRP